MEAEAPKAKMPAASAKATGANATVPRRDKSLSALSHELIARYGQDGTIIDLDEVQARAWPPATGARGRASPRACLALTPRFFRAPPRGSSGNLPELEEATTL